MISAIQSARLGLRTFLFLLGLQSALAQAPSPGEIDAAIASMARSIDTAYVFPEKGKQIAEHLTAEHRQGKFSGAKSWKELADSVTKNLKAFARDGHLYVGYDPKTVEALQKPPGSDKTNMEEGHNSFFEGKDVAARNFGFQEVKILEGNVGYIRISEINISSGSLPVLFAAMRFVANTRALVIDLQNNGGGGSNVGNVMESFFLPKETPLLDFKTRNGSTHMEKTVAWLLEPRYEKPLFVLVNRGTASAAEAFAFSLQKHGRAKVVGQRSAGGAFMNSWYPVNQHLYISVSTGAPTWPGTHLTWETTGVQPDHIVQQGGELAAVAGLLR